MVIWLHMQQAYSEALLQLQGINIMLILLAWQGTNQRVYFSTTAVMIHLFVLMDVVQSQDINLVVAGYRKQVPVRAHLLLQSGKVGQQM